MELIELIGEDRLINIGYDVFFFLLMLFMLIGDDMLHFVGLRNPIVE